MKNITTRLKVLFLVLAVLSLVAAGNAGWKEPGGGCYGVPEPASIVLLGGGLAALGIIAKRKKK